MAEHPRVHHSRGHISARSDRPQPPLSRYSRVEEAPAGPEEAATAADAGPATDTHPDPDPALAAQSPEPDVEAEPEPSAQTNAQAAAVTDADARAPEQERIEAPVDPSNEVAPSAPAAQPEVVDSLPPALADDPSQRRSNPPAAALVAVQPDPAAEGHREKVPFWKRIALPRAVAAAVEGPSRRQSLEPIVARLNALEKQIAANQSATETHLDRFEENITRLWELEEQMTLTEVRERLALLEANQEEIADGLHAVSRNVSILAIVLAIAVAAALLGAGLAI